MTLTLRWRPDEADGTSVEVADGGWGTVVHAEPDACVHAVLHTHDGVLVTVDGEPLDGLRARRGAPPPLAVVTGRIGMLPTLRVADVVLLGLDSPQPPLWRALLGTRAARAMSADDEAHARALAGRMGLARWMDEVAAELPADVEALADLARAVAGRPRAVLWRRPQWLPPERVDELREVLAAEQRLAGFGVLELAQGPPDTLPPS